MNTEVKRSIIEALSNELLYQIEVHNGLIPAYIVKKHDGSIPYIHNQSLSVLKNLLKLSSIQTLQQLLNLSYSAEVTTTLHRTILKTISGHLISHIPWSLIHHLQCRIHNTHPSSWWTVAINRHRWHKHSRLRPYTTSPTCHFRGYMKMAAQELQLQVERPFLSSKNSEQFLGSQDQVAQCFYCLSSSFTGPVPATDHNLDTHHLHKIHDLHHPGYLHLRHTLGKHPQSSLPQQHVQLRRPDGSVGMALVLPALTDCRWWIESLLVHSGVSSATRRKATGADHKKAAARSA